MGQSNNEKQPLKPPAAQLPGIISQDFQRDLFEITDGSSESPLRTYTNVMVLWDMLPKYDVWGTNRRYHPELAPEERVRTLPVRHRVHLENLTSGQNEVYAQLELEISPAYIEVKKLERSSEELANGKVRSKKRVVRDERGNAVYERVYVYPGPREDKVEEALKFLLAHGQGDFEPDETWVKFSVRQLQRELERTSIRMNLDDIKESLQVLADSKCKIFGIDSETGKRKSVLSSSFLPQLAMVSRDQYESALRSGEETRCYAQFHMLVTQGIRENQFRMTNYRQHQRLDHLLSRFIHKVLRIEYTNASSPERPFAFHMNKVLMEFGRISDRRDNNLNVFRTALDELKEQNIIADYSDEKLRDPRDRRVIVDRVFHCFPTSEFIHEMVKSNSSHKRNRIRLDEMKNTRQIALSLETLAAEQKKAARKLATYDVAMAKAIDLALEYSPEEIAQAIRKSTASEKSRPGEVHNLAGLIIKVLETSEKQVKSKTVKTQHSEAREVNKEKTSQVDVSMLSTLSEKQTKHLLTDWENWKESDRQAFNKYGLSSPYVRSELFGMGE